MSWRNRPDTDPCIWFEWHPDEGSTLPVIDVRFWSWILRKCILRVFVWHILAFDVFSWSTHDFLLLWDVNKSKLCITEPTKDTNRNFFVSSGINAHAESEIESSSRPTQNCLFQDNILFAGRWNLFLPAAEMYLAGRWNIFSQQMDIFFAGRWNLWRISAGGHRWTWDRVTRRTRKCQMARDNIVRGKSPPATEIGGRQKSVRDTD